MWHFFMFFVPFAPVSAYGNQLSVFLHGGRRDNIRLRPGTIANENKANGHNRHRSMPFFSYTVLFLSFYFPL